MLLLSSPGKKPGESYVSVTKTVSIPDHCLGRVTGRNPNYSSCTLGWASIVSQASCIFRNRLRGKFFLSLSPKIRLACETRAGGRSEIVVVTSYALTLDCLRSQNFLWSIRQTLPACIEPFHRLLLNRFYAAKQEEGKKKVLEPAV